MSDIQRYQFCPNCTPNTITRERRPNGNDKCWDCNHVWPSKESIYYITEKDHKKAIEAKDAFISEQNIAINQLTGHCFRDKEIEILFQNQAKEIEQLKSEINDACQHLDDSWSDGDWLGVERVLLRFDEVLK